MRIHVHIAVGYGLKNYPLRGTFSPELHKQDMYGGREGVVDKNMGGGGELMFALRVYTTCCFKGEEEKDEMWRK